MSEEDQAKLVNRGYGNSAKLTLRPAIVVIDATYAFTGLRGETLEKGLERWPSSCGPTAWSAVDRIQVLLAAARARKLPIFYSHMTTARPNGVVQRRSRAVGSGAGIDGPDGNSVVAELRPEPNDLIISKTAPSVFFGTPLVAFLHSLRVDSLILCGGTTSGCIRATAVDAFSYDYPVVVAEDAVFDRSPTSHAISLYDLHTRYAEVLRVEETIQAMAVRPF